MIRRQTIGIIFFITSFLSLPVGYAFNDYSFVDTEFATLQEGNQLAVSQQAETATPSILGKLVDLVSTANYYTTDKLVFGTDIIDIANLSDYQATIDLSCKGSGAVVRPFKSVKILVGNKPKDVSAGTTTTEHSDWLSKISGFTLAPHHVFMIKMILLAKTEIDQIHFIQEAAKLMMRLSITEPYRSNLGAYLNFAAQDKDMMSIILSKVLIRVLPQDWMTALQSAAQCITSPAAYNAGMKIKVLVFGKKDPKDKVTDTIVEDAKNVINACEDKNTCLDKLNELLLQRGYEVTNDYVRFETFNKGKVNPFVGKICFEGSLHDLPQGAIRDDVLKNTASSQAVVVNSEARPFGPFVISFTNDILGARDSVCAITALLIKAFQEYVATKVQLGLGFDGKSFEQLDQEAEQQALVRAFLMTDEGKESQERLAQEIKDICTFDATKIKALIRAAKKELDELKNEQEEIIAELEALIDNSDEFESGYVEEVQQELKNQEQIIAQKIKTVEQTIARYTGFKKNGSKEISLEQKLFVREQAVKVYREEANAVVNSMTLQPILAYGNHLNHVAYSIEKQNSVIREFLAMEQSAAAYEKLKLVLAPIINDNEFFGLPVNGQPLAINFDFIINDLMSNDSSFDGVNALLLQCKEMLKQSTLLKENKIMVEYLIKLLCPSYASYLSAIIL